MRRRLNNTGPAMAGYIEAPFTANEGMEAFDQLPTEIRHALNYARTKWSAADILGAMRRGYTVRQVLERLKAAD